MSFVDFRHREIDFAGLYEAARPWSHGERLIVALAWDLFNGGDEGGGWCNVSDLIDTLNADAFRLAMEAICLRAGVLPWRDPAVYDGNGRDA